MKDTMMNDLMADMWQNINNLPTVKWIKDVSLNKDIEPKQIGLQTLDSQKNAIDTIYKATLLLQEQAEKMVEPLLKNIPGIPEGWGDMFKKNQGQIKKVVDESFVKAESYLYPNNDVKQKSQPPKAEKKQGKAIASVS